MANGEQSLLLAARDRLPTLFANPKQVEKARSLLMTAVFADRERP